jgi:Peptidase family M23
LRTILIIVLLLLGTGFCHAAQEIIRPRLSSSVIDWTGALGAVAKLAAGSNEHERSIDILTRLNAASAQYLPNIAASSVPVLLPVDMPALLRDGYGETGNGQVANGKKYFSGFPIPRFFLSGLAGYDATFTIQTSDIREVADISLPDPVEVQISGFTFTYDVAHESPESRPVPALEARFPGIKRLLQEGHVRYVFVKYGVPYVVSIECFDGRPRLLRLICTQADRIALHFLNLLHIAGGAPQPTVIPDPPIVARPELTAENFSYHSPGKLYPGSGFRGAGGRVDYTVFAPIRFPLAEAPAYANSQIYRDRERPRSKTSGRETTPSADYSYPWRDNFCERRGFAVGQCLSGIGHQGQDIRPAPCAAPLGNDRCDPAHNLVAVRDGAIMRSPKHEAVYVVINTANEHMRFRYLHMDPRKMDEDNLLSGRAVREGEVIGQVSNYSKKENGTTYHLHFDMQVPTRTGWLFVSPYMTLVTAYERLIGARGVEIVDEPQTGQAPEADFGQVAQPAATAPVEKRGKGRRDKVRDATENGKDQARANDY